MPLSGPQLARGHLRLAPAPAGRRRSDSRAALLARTALVTIAVAWTTATAWLLAALALLPLLWKRAPLGRRIRPQPRRDARVIPFHRRRSPPQQQAMR